MSDILCQDEINALLSAYQSASHSGTGVSAETPDREVRLYDFSRPDRISKDYLKVLSLIHANFAGSLSTVLSGIYQTSVRVEFTGINQIPFKEYRVSLPNRTLFVEVSMAPLNGDFLLDINPEIIGTWVDCLCGVNTVEASEPSNLSAIDLAISKKMIKTYLQSYADSWAGMISIQPEINKIADSDTYESAHQPSETVLVCTFEINHGDSISMMTICIPSAGIESLQKMLVMSSNTRIANRENDNIHADQIKSALADVSLPCKVIIGRTNISFSDAMNLEVGDVIKTASKCDSPIEMFVGSNHMFYCRPGVKGNNISVVISSVAIADE